MLGGAALEKAGLTPEMLQEFKDRLKYRGANLNPNEAMQNELNHNVAYFRNVGDDVGGFNGLKGAAISKVLPEAVTPEIQTSINQISEMSQKAVKEMADKGVPESYIKKFQNTYNGFLETATNPNASVAQHFDAINGFKKELQDFSKGNWGPFAVKSFDPAYDFLNVTKNLSRDVRLTLEDAGVWGKDASNLQKTLNAAFSEANPFVKQAENKFMSALGNERVVDPQKFVTYMNQSGKATTPTVRQQLLGKFVESMNGFHEAVENAYSKAGLPMPDRPGLGALKDSISLPSMGTKLADAWYDKIGHFALGNALGAGAGAALFPGISGVYLGRWALGPVFSAILKPVLENVTNHAALDQAVKFGSNILKGDILLKNAMKGLFSGGEMLPKHLMPTADRLDKLEESIKDLAENQGKMINVAGDLGHYMPDHAQALAQHTMNAVNALNSQRPQSVKQGPLDEDAPISSTQKSEYRQSLAIAQQPLIPLMKIQTGTLAPQDVITLKTLYPNFYNKVSQEIMDHMTKHIAKGETVPYKLRAGLSMFLAQPLDGTFTPMAIQSAQSTFMAMKPPQAPKAAGGSKKTEKLSKVADSYRTSEQSAIARQSQQS